MSHPSKDKKLKTLLDEVLPEVEGRAINEDLFERIKKELVEWGGPSLENYHPVVEMAKLANSMHIKDELKYRVNAEIASYMYPKVKSFEISKKEDKTINLNINIAGYAKSNKIVEIEAEDIELNDEDDEDKDLATRMMS